MPNNPINVKGKNRQARWIVSLGLAIGVGLGFATLLPHRTSAQFLDPPLGWDMWDPGVTQRDIWESDRMDRNLRWRFTRHNTFIEDGVPKAYHGASNPLPKTPETIRTGGELYADKCASCHDASGMGDGAAGLALYPSPALLTHLIRMPSRVDEYLIWAIADGGEPFATDMPAFKDDLSDDQIWQIVTYMRAGFPTIDERGPK